MGEVHDITSLVTQRAKRKHFLRVGLSVPEKIVLVCIYSGCGKYIELDRPAVTGLLTNGDRRLERTDLGTWSICDRD